MVVAELSAENDGLFLQVEEMRRECGVAWSIAAGMPLLEQPADEAASQLAEPPEQQAAGAPASDPAVTAAGATSAAAAATAPIDVVGTFAGAIPASAPAGADAGPSSPPINLPPAGLTSASHSSTSLFVSHVEWTPRKPFVSYARQLFIVRSSGLAETQPRYHAHG